MRPETMTPASRLLGAMLARPWFVARHMLPAVVERMHQRAVAASRMDVAALEAALAAYQQAPLGRVEGAVAVIPMTGVIVQKAEDAWWYGGSSIDRMRHAFRTYLADPQVTAIVFYVDSPGGEVYGVPEFFDEIYAARGSKPLVAVCEPVMASAAYWLGAACDEIYMLPSGTVGSVGCYTMHQNVEGWLEQLGIVLTFIQHGEHKTDGNPYQALSDAARADLQRSVDFYGGLFDKGVALARGKTVEEVLESFGQGRMFHAPEARRIGMIDKVGSLEMVVGKLNPKRGRIAAAGEAAPVTSIAATADQDDEGVEPNEDGTCPDDHEMGEDGRCHMRAKAAAAPVAEGPSDADRIAVSLAVLGA